MGRGEHWGERWDNYNRITIKKWESLLGKKKAGGTNSFQA